MRRHLFSVCSTASVVVIISIIVVALCFRTTLLSPTYGNKDDLPTATKTRARDTTMSIMHVNSHSTGDERVQFRIGLKLCIDNKDPSSLIIPDGGRSKKNLLPNSLLNLPLCDEDETGSIDNAAVVSDDLLPILFSSGDENEMSHNYDDTLAYEWFHFQMTQIINSLQNEQQKHRNEVNTVVERRADVVDRIAKEEDEPPLSTSDIYYNAGMALICVCVAALAAGLTMGMLSIDPLYLMIKMRCGTKKERAQASSIFPLIQQHHRLLVTLLLLNSAANEALPLFLDKLVPAYAAVIISVTLVLIFGEIIPSAVFTGPNQIPMASFMSPMVKFTMILLCPLSWPIAKTLDLLLGHHESEELSNLYDRGELSALVRIMYEQERAEKERRKDAEAKLIGYVSPPTTTPNHITTSERTLVGTVGGIVRNNRETRRTAFESLKEVEQTSNILEGDGKKNEEGEGEKENLEREVSMHVDEVNMVEGALQMRTKFAKDVLTPIDRVFGVEKDCILDEDTLTMIYSAGHSRLPVYVRRPLTPEQREGKDEGYIDRGGICGLLMTRQLIVVDSDDKRPLSSMPLLQPATVEPDTHLVDLLNMFQKVGPSSVRGGHLAIVCDDALLADEALEQGEPIPKEAGVLGIVTIEDVIEELLQEEIVDESDRQEYIGLQRAKKAVRKWKRFVRRRIAQRGEPIPPFVLPASSSSRLQDDKSVTSVSVNLDSLVEGVKKVVRGDDSGAVVPLLGENTISKQETLSSRSSTKHVHYGSS